MVRTTNSSSAKVGNVRTIVVQTVKIGTTNSRIAGKEVLSS